jgi:hypothetical protein
MTQNTAFFMRFKIDFKVFTVCEMKRLLGYIGVDVRIILKCTKELRCEGVDWRPPLWSSGQSFWLRIQRFRVRFSALPDFLRRTGTTQPPEDN